MKRVLTAVLLSLFMLPSFAAEIPVLSAGIGEEDRQAHDEYSLKLVFFETGGPYVANVRVRIYDQDGGQLLDYLSPAPWLFVGLEAGSYSVRAERENGDAQGASFTLDGEGQRRLSLRFPVLE